MLKPAVFIHTTVTVLDWVDTNFFYVIFVIILFQKYDLEQTSS